VTWPDTSTNQAAAIALCSRFDKRVTDALELDTSVAQYVVVAVQAEPMVSQLEYTLARNIDCRMRKDGDFAYYEQERDTALVDTHLTRKSELRSPAASHHLVGGFNRRVLMLATSRHMIEEITHSPKDAPIGVYRATDLAIQLNAYYLNLCGALDNLAWAMQYEWGVLPGVTETGKRRFQCGLFSPAFMQALLLVRPAVADALEAHRSWYQDLRMLRDPAAHRVPLYAIPGYLTETDAIEYNRLQALAGERREAGDHHGTMELIHQASQLGSYAPLMSVWTPDGEKLVDAWEAVVRDHHQFQKVAQRVSAELFPIHQPG
jgi:hypothetical protein